MNTTWDAASRTTTSGKGPMRGMIWSEAAICFRPRKRRFSLAGIALDEGDREKAKQLYRTASRARGELGREALEAYVKLDLVDFPERYVTADIYFDEDQVVLKVANSTVHELKDVMIEIETIVNGVPGRPRLREVARIGARSFEVVETGDLSPGG